MRKKKWIYVMAEAPRNDLTMVSFSHHTVFGHDEHDAYNDGFNKFKQEAKNDGYVFLNDYVIRAVA